jgi:hypothetical protein
VASVLGVGAAEAFHASGGIGVAVLFGVVLATGLAAVGTVRAVAVRTRSR